MEEEDKSLLNVESRGTQMAGEGIHAGFPSPATDFMTDCIDLNKELVRHPAATFFGRVVGNSMIEAGVEEGDVLVIDKSIEPKEGDMAVCFLDGEFTLKYISYKNNGELWLRPANSQYPDIKVDESMNFMVWGIVTYFIKKVNYR